MADGVRTQDGVPVGGWVLRADPARFDVAPMLEEFGQVFRYPLDPSDRTSLLAAGQPCFLFQADRSKVVGMWAVGEVVAPVLTAPVDPEDPSAGEQLLAEVELLPLVKPIPLAKLRDQKAFADSELLTAPDQPDPLVLRPQEVRTLEEFDFTVVEPTDEQLARLEEVLGDDADDEFGTVIFELAGVERTLGIRIDGAEDSLLSVYEIDDSGAYELGRFEDVLDALDLIGLRGAELQLAPPVSAAEPDALPQGDPVGVLRTEDGDLFVYRTGPEQFDLYDPAPGSADDDVIDLDDDWDDDAPMLLGRFETLDEVLGALAESVEDVPDEG